MNDFLKICYKKFIFKPSFSVLELFHISDTILISLLLIFEPTFDHSFYLSHKVKQEKQLHFKMLDKKFTFVTQSSCLPLTRAQFQTCRQEDRRHVILLNKVYYFYNLFNEKLINKDIIN